MLKSLITRRLFLAVALLSATASSIAAEANSFDPPALYLTWQRDPTTTMTIHWHTTNANARTELQFRKLDGGTWQKATGSNHPMPYTGERTIHTVELTGLSPETYYLFRFTEGSKEYKFRTMQRDLSKPIRFVSGGDAYHQRDWMDKMNKLAANLDPDFVVLGGDLAYAVTGKVHERDNLQRWFDYFDSWKKNAIAPDGRLLPKLVILGNHEVVGFWDQTPDAAKGFYSFFSMPGKQGYNHLDFGNYLTLLLLDSQHTHPVAGEQTEWLKKTLSKRRSVPHIIPFYHIPAYPSARAYDSGENGHINIAIREHWVPLFEKYGVKVAFEHHDHSYKRTHPIRAGKIDPKGIVYLGDGAWGVRLRKTHPVESTWYLANGGDIRHLFLVTLYSDQRHIVSVNEEGKIFDEVYQRVK